MNPNTTGETGSDSIPESVSFGAQEVLEWVSINSGSKTLTQLDQQLTLWAHDTYPKIPKSRRDQLNLNPKVKTSLL